MLVLMKKRIMGEKGMKNGEFHHFWVISATCTGTGVEQGRYSPPKPNLYWYRCGTASRTEPVPVQVKAVPLQVVLCFSISTSVRILAITFSFLIRFE